MLAATLAVLPAAARAEVSLSLQDALERGGAQSATVKKATAERDASDALRDRALSHFAPTLSLTANAGTSKDLKQLPGEALPETTREHNVYSAGVELRQSVFRGLSDYYGMSAAKAAVLETETALKSARLEAREEILGAYFGIQLDVARLAAEEESASAEREQLQIVTNKLKAGSATELDQLQAQYQVEAHKPKVAALKVELGKKKLRFAHLLGLPLDEDFKLSTSLETAYAASLQAQVMGVADAVKTALDGNVGLARLRASRSKQEYSAEERRGQHWPKVDFVLRADTNAYQRADIGTPPTRGVSGMVEVSVPLFSGLSSVAERAEDHHRLVAIDQDFEAAKDTLIEDLLGGFRDFELAKEQTESERSNVQLAGRTVEKARTLYQAGRTTLKEVLDGYAQQTEARKNLAQAMYQRVTSLARIQKAVGG